MFLAINIGNTSVQCGLFDGDTLLRTGRFAGGDAKQRLAEFLAACPRVVKTAVASVNEPVRKKVSASVSRILKSHALIVGKDFPIPIPSLTRKPAATGVDRLLNALAAYTREERLHCHRHRHRNHR